MSETGLKIMGFLLSAGEKGRGTIVSLLGYAAEYGKCVEVVARAIASSDGSDWGTLDEPTRGAYCRRAKAAVLGLRDFVKG